MTALNTDTTAPKATTVAPKADKAALAPKHPNAVWFNDLLSNWQPATMGTKPTIAQLSVPLWWGYRAGVEALHLAMCLRPEGCTVAQFCTAGSCGPANNKRTDVVKHRKLATVTVEGKPYAFKLVLTAAGRTAIENAVKKAAEGDVAPKKAVKADKAPAVATGKIKGVKASPVAPKAKKAASKGRKGTVTVPVTDHTAEGVTVPVTDLPKAMQPADTVVNAV